MDVLSAHECTDGLVRTGPLVHRWPGWRPDTPPTCPATPGRRWAVVGVGKPGLSRHLVVPGGDRVRLRPRAGPVVLLDGEAPLAHDPDALRLAGQSGVLGNQDQGQ